MRKSITLALLCLAASLPSRAQQGEADSLTLKSSSTSAVVTTVVHEENFHTRRPVATFSQLLQGVMPGIQATLGGSNPSVDSRLLVRGSSSILFPTAPLVVVDGMPYTGGMFSLNLLDIEFLEVNKDAATTVLYGSRAANGVIEVTTKRGRAGKPQLNFQLSKGVSTRGVADYERVGVKDFMELKWESLNSRFLSSGYKPSDAARYTSEYLLSGGYLNSSNFNLPYKEVMRTDGTMNPKARLPFGDTGWDDALFQRGQRTEYAVDASGGTEHSKYFVSAGYLNDEGYVRYNGAQRYTARANVSVTPVKWFKFGLNLAGSIQEVNNPTELNSVTPIEYARRVGPIYPVFQHKSNGEVLKDAKGVPIYSTGIRVFSGFSPDLKTKNDTRTEEVSTLVGLLYGRFDLLKGLTLDLSGGIDNANNNLRVTNTSYYSDATPYYNLSASGSTRRQNWQAKQQFTYTYRDSEQSFKAFAGFEKLHNQADLDYVETGVYPNYDFNSRFERFQRNFNRTTEGIFAGVAYTLRDRYILESAIRTDKLPIVTPSNNVWYGFWSMSGAWVISEESFLKYSSTISRLKLRASVGRVGNDGISSYLSWNSMEDYLKQTSSGTWLYYLDPIAMEATNQTNLGLDLGLMNNRLYATVDFFNHRANHINSLSSFYPLSNADQYYGLRNRGVEVSVGGSLISTRHLQWNVQVNATHYTSQLTHVGKGISIYDANTPYQQRLVEGESLYSFYLPTYVGVNPKNGAPMYLTNSRTYSNTPNNKTYQYNGKWVTENSGRHDDETNQGSAIPDLFGGISSNLWYKNFSLSFLLSYQLGGKIYDYAYQQLMQCQATNGYTMHTDLLNRWQKEGDRTNIPQIDRTIASSSYYLSSASYLSLRSVVLSYSLPKKWIERVNMRRIEVYAAGENLLILSARKGLYPTANLHGIAGNEYVPARTVSLGVNIGF